MATVNFSVPDDVKNAFNKTFKNQNKSAVIADLMRQAVEDARASRKRRKSIDQLLSMRHPLEPMTQGEFRRLREQGRP